MSEHLKQRLSFTEKAGFSLGDAGANFVFQTLMIFQFTFFTEVFGISGAVASWIFLFGRFFDAFTDPAMGIIADRTKTRWGRFRPWLVWSAVPFALIFWLTFTTPSFGESAKVIYAWLMYFALMAMYTVNNVPYCAIGGVMTADVDERTSVSQYRFFAAMGASLIVSSFTWPLVAKFGNGDDAKGWSITIGIFALVSIVLFIITFFSVKERVEPDPNQQSSIKDDLRDVFSNRPWVVLFFATLAIFVTLVVRGGTLPMFTKNYVDHGALRGFLEVFGFAIPEGAQMGWWQHLCDKVGYFVRPDDSNVQNVGFGFMNLMGNLVTITGVLLAKPLAAWFGKKLVFTTGIAATAVVTVLLFFIPRDAIWLQFFQGMLWAACYGPTIPLLWAMIADAADFGEWTTGRRATGFVFAGVVFALKFGLGIGGFIQARALGLFGYMEDATSSAESLFAIRMVAAVVPAVFLAVAVVILFFYPISKELNYQIGDELAERRRKRAAEASA